MNTSPGMGSLNLAGGLNASRCRATGQTWGGRHRATICPVSPWFHQRAFSGSSPEEKPRCRVNTLAISSAETVFTQLVSPSKPLQQHGLVVDLKLHLELVRGHVRLPRQGPAGGVSRQQSSSFSSCCVVGSGRRGRMKSSIRAKRPGRSSSNHPASEVTESIRALALLPLLGALPG